MSGKHLFKLIKKASIGQKIDRRFFPLKRLIFNKFIIKAQIPTKTHQMMRYISQ